MPGPMLDGETTLGFCALTLVCGLVVRRGLGVATRTVDRLGLFVALAITTLFGLKALGYLMDSLALSASRGGHGRSAFWVTCAALGILINVSGRDRFARPPGHSGDLR